jgi:TM2 domain-containing membrane protein YozV
MRTYPHPGTASVLSLLFPGAGQLAAGHTGKAVYFFLLSIFMWAITFGWFGWIINICAASDAWHLCTKDQREPSWTT